MYIEDRLFSEYNGEVLYSVTMTEDEYDLFSLYQKEFNKKTKLKDKIAALDNAAEQQANKAAKYRGRVESVAASMKKHGYTDINQLTGRYKDWVSNSDFKKALEEHLAGNPNYVSQTEARLTRAAAIASNTANDITVNHVKTGKSAVSEKGLNLEGHGGNIKGSNVKVDGAGNVKATLNRSSAEGGRQVEIVNRLPKEDKRKAKRLRRRLETGMSKNEVKVAVTPVKQRNKGGNNKITEKAKETLDKIAARDNNTVNEARKAAGDFLEGGKKPSVTVVGPKTNNVVDLTNGSKYVDPKKTTKKAYITPRVKQQLQTAGENIQGANVVPTPTPTGGGFSGGGGGRGAAAEAESGFKRLLKNKKLLAGAGIGAGVIGGGAYLYNRNRRKRVPVS